MERTSQQGRQQESDWLRWRPILAGSVVAVACSWLGELLGGVLVLADGGGAGVGAWFGGLVAMLAIGFGAMVGAALSARLIGASTRGAGAGIGLVVWGVVATFSAFSFALLGGNVALIAGGTPDAAQLSLGLGTLGLIVALFGALVGGSIGATRELEVLRRKPRAPGAALGGREARREVEAGMRPPAAPSERREEPPPIH